ncbi:glycerophosphodiester phosphodiesterase [Arthrobacter crystallopoietes BAB-32]|uniref:Glycerophosphodiester phosphodiesterase n=1 Tax=Arthrobacter crystallopoietes BAB-32 TaxID=1246476 RepID=N1UXH4_9MICC|nr:glycerophosphodiester phosphodiesterase [Arthrobacter crystallopoietes]EMY32469.1 glycerophosphodiester phosphodiesterase [Arthrobacter crystallopoietes BAB-32]
MKFRYLLAAALLPMLAGCTSGPDDGFVFVAHRGGDEMHPESSQEALTAAADAGFPVEFDLRKLRDGGWAIVHDPATDDSVRSVSGPIEDITGAQWDAARLSDGGRSGRTATWDWVVDELPDDVLLVPELKDRKITADDFAEAVRRAGVEDRVIVQSFDFATAKRLAGHGLDTLFLMTAKSAESPAEIAAAGISHVGPSKATSEARLRELKEAGLKVWVWTVNDAESAADLRMSGYVDGVFTDKPHALSGGRIE